MRRAANIILILTTLSCMFLSFDYNTQAKHEAELIHTKTTAFDRGYRAGALSCCDAMAARSVTIPASLKAVKYE